MLARARRRVKVCKSLNSQQLAGLRQGLIDELFEAQRPLGELAIGGGLLLAGAEAFVGDIQRHEHRHAQEIVGRRGFGCRAHFLIDIGSKLGDVRGVEPAANGVSLAADLHRHDTGHK